MLPGTSEQTPPPLKEKSNFRKGGFLLVHFSILENLPGFYSFQNPRAKFGRAFIKFRFWPTQPKAGSHFWSTQNCRFPLRNPIFGYPKSSKFSRALRARVFILSKIFPALRAGFYFVHFFFQIFARVFILFNFHFPKTRPGFY